MNEDFKLEALFDAVIVEPIPTDDTEHGGIIVPDVGKEKNTTAKVKAVGPGKRTVTGEFIETVVKVGTTVVLPTMGFTKFDYKGTEYYIGPENSILAIINE